MEERMTAKRKQPDLSTLCADVRRFHDVINKESDLAVVLISSSFLDETLRSLLKAHLRKAKVTDRLLDTTFARKVDLAFSLKLIEKKEHSALKQIGKIRNDFAHSHLQLSFADKGVGKACEKLQYLPTVVKESEENGKMTVLPHFLQLAVAPRGRYTMTAVILANALLNRAIKTAEQKAAPLPPEGAPSGGR